MSKTTTPSAGLASDLSAPYTIERVNDWRRGTYCCRLGPIAAHGPTRTKALQNAKVQLQAYLEKPQELTVVVGARTVFFTKRDAAGNLYLLGARPGTGRTEAYNTYVDDKTDLQAIAYKEVEPFVGLLQAIGKLATLSVPEIELKVARQQLAEAQREVAELRQKLRDTSRFMIPYPFSGRIY